MDRLKWAWQILGMAALTTLAILLLSFALAVKKVDSYYLSRVNAGSFTVEGTCIWAHWTWHVDENVYCTADTALAVQLVKQLNETVK